MPGEQIRLQVTPELFGSRISLSSEFTLLVRQQKMHRSQRCYGELDELTVDDFWQIADAGDQELRRLAHSSRRGTLELDAEDND